MLIGKSNTIKNLKFIIIPLFIIMLSFAVVGCSQNSNKIKTTYNDNVQITGLKHFDGYQLQQSTIVSRHDLRSAIKEKGEPYINATNVDWQEWTSSPGDLTLKGGQNEVLMGQYFRKFFESENMFEENWIPKDDEVLFYSNSNQRTIATTNYFSSGFLPVAEVNVKHNYELGKNDPVFSRKITKSSQEYKDQVNKEVCDNFNVDSVDGILMNLESNLKKMESFFDFKNSKYAKDNNIESLPLDDTELIWDAGKGSDMTGSLNTANKIVDAFKMQFYEVEDDTLALFGKEISFKDLMDIFAIDNAYQKVMKYNHTYAVDFSNLLFKELKNDIENKNRKVTFLCGHDSTVIPMLAALNVEEYNLPNTIDELCPIGSKVVFNKYVDKEGKQYCDIELVYLTLDQIRHRYTIDLQNPPMAVPLNFEGIQKNDDGLYKMEDVISLIDKAIAEYDNWQ